MSCGKNKALLKIVSTPIIGMQPGIKLTWMISAADLNCSNYNVSPLVKNTIEEVLL